MADLPDARRVPPLPSEDALCADALYNQGMSHYRRHQWHEAQACFEQLQKLDPGRRGVADLLDELAIFINLESLDTAARTEAAPRPEDAAAPPARPNLASRLLPILSATALVVALLAFLAHNNARARAARPAAELQDLGQAYLAAQQWPEAVGTFEQLLLISPVDPAARTGLWTAYYERGDQRAGQAQGLEERGLFQEAVDPWGAALADFRAALEVDPSHSADPRGDLPTRIATAEQHRRCGARLSLALKLCDERRWPEAIQSLQALREQEPTYHPEAVAARLGDALLQSGQEILSGAFTGERIQEGIDMLEHALLAQPANVAAQAALAQARAYLAGVSGAGAHDWTAAINSLQPLVGEAPAYAQGRARDLLCQSHLERAGELEQVGKLRQSLIDYQALVTLHCSQQAAAERKVQAIALSLTPTATPTLRPTPVLTATLSITVPVPILTSG